jgi:Fe-Mn family superoxide dismutase
MSFTLPELPYAKDALAPHLSAETLEFHHGKHHAAYVNNLNNFAKDDTSLAGKSIEDLVRTSSGKVFNNAAQVWNHTFYWHSMRPGGGGEPTGAVADAIQKSFGSFAAFKEKFSAVAAGHFGSGWAWLIEKDGKLAITSTPNQDAPMMKGVVPDAEIGKPLLGVDQQVLQHSLARAVVGDQLDQVVALRGGVLGVAADVEV